MNKKILLASMLVLSGAANATYHCSLAVSVGDELMDEIGKTSMPAVAGHPDFIKSADRDALFLNACEDGYQDGLREDYGDIRHGFIEAKRRFKGLSDDDVAGRVRYALDVSSLTAAAHGYKQGRAVYRASGTPLTAVVED